MERKQQQLDWKPANLKRLELSIYPSLDPDSQESSDKIEMEYNNDFGSFETVIDVPKNADLQMYDIDVRANKETLGSKSFTVGDPRPPTAGLKLDAQSWVCTYLCTSSRVPCLQPSLVLIKVKQIGMQ